MNKQQYRITVNESVKEHETEESALQAWENLLYIAKERGYTCKLETRTIADLSFLDFFSEIPAGWFVAKSKNLVITPWTVMQEIK